MSAHLKAEEARTRRDKNESGQVYSHRHTLQGEGVQASMLSASEMKLRKTSFEEHGTAMT